MNKETLYTIENFDFNSLFATAEVTTSNTLPESCAGLNALREMKNAMAIAKYKFDNKI